VLVAILTPHFDLPFRIASGSPAVVEQDGYSDIANCAEAIIRTPQGFRVYDDKAEFGIPMLEFDLIPIDVQRLSEIIQEQDPRVQILGSEEMDSFDTHVDRLRMEIWPTSDSQ
jgi:hypothetical protein